MVVLPAAKLSGQRVCQVVGAAGAVGFVAAHLHFDVVAPALGVLRQDVEHDEFASQIFGRDARVKHLDHRHRRLVRAYRVDQRSQQHGRTGKQLFENKVVFGVKQGVAACLGYFGCRHGKPF